MKKLKIETGIADGVLLLPPSSEPVNALFNRYWLQRELIENHGYNIPDLRKVLYANRNDNPGHARHTIAWRANGELILVYLGPHKGWRQVFSFGYPAGRGRTI